MGPLVVREYIEAIINDKIKNLHPDIKNDMIEDILNSGLKAKYKIVNFIRQKLMLPKVGSDKRIYWERRGWNIEEVEEKRTLKSMPSSPMKWENWLFKINDKTGNLYTVEEAKYKVRSFRKLNIEYWIEKGYSDNEAKIKVKEYQKENSNKFVSKMIDNPEKYLDRTTTQIQYWTKKGFSFDDAKAKIKQNQDKTSLDYNIKRYGEEDGIIRYNSLCAVKSYNNSLEYYISKYGETIGNNIYNDILERRMVKTSRASKESFRFFKDIYIYLRKNGIKKNDIYWGVGHSNEWFINSNGVIKFYDFTVPIINLVIEYHGIKFHPNESDIKINRQEWKCLFSGESFHDKLKSDRYKKDIIISKGFDYIEVFSSDDLNKSKKDIIKMIKKKIKKDD